ncbi:hypothetical protein SDRG_03486 [Saprolegnia diclina VS20]|uniref:Uncharacterized protein n=1 Tax=Saprolegnia diclina (strain VS20) TaxID=1156394 RepID=T0S2Q4_SAPDV|nr:hypothetical protein SDRG_03486 [Saprolegnia diclina VS20]EQC39283.1 hypothetical protein SDRG_03486 [Saprolegnia diclina VS20]|eukprot:XP_008607344.1 hypothetical protein SDRG_03486 [Saprolegnia diclina VS20]
MRLIWLLLLALAASPFAAAPQLEQLPPRRLSMTKELQRISASAINVGYEALTAASPWTSEPRPTSAHWTCSNVAAILTLAVVITMV